MLCVTIVYLLLNEVHHGFFQVFDSCGYVGYKPVSTGFHGDLYFLLFEETQRIMTIVQSTAKAWSSGCFSEMLPISLVFEWLVSYPRQCFWRPRRYDFPGGSMSLQQGKLQDVGHFQSLSASFSWLKLWALSWWSGFHAFAVMMGLKVLEL